jgi:hypothetical protein
MKLTDEHVPDSKALSGSVIGVIKLDSMVSTGKLIADCAYGGNIIFRFLPAIEIRIAL